MNLPWPAPLSANALADHLWQSTVFALAVWLLSFLLRNNQARIRYALWLAASFKFLLPFCLLITLGSLLPQPSHAVSATPETIYSAVALPPSPLPAGNPPPSHATRPRALSSSPRTCPPSCSRSGSPERSPSCSPGSSGGAA